MITKEQLNQVIEMACEGYTCTAIARKLNFTRSSLSSDLCRQGTNYNSIVKLSRAGKSAKEISAELLSSAKQAPVNQNNITKPEHPMLNRRCLIRTYSAGVHIGDVVYIDGMEAKLENALRLWKWEGGGLSLSAVANNGIKGGRLNRTGEVYLTNVIEFIPTTKNAEDTYVKFIEN